MTPLAERSTARGTGPIPSLDGVRALAVLLVFFAHSSLDKIVPGGLGVTIFFVLSGYLISTLMRIEYARSGKLDIRGFYLRRLLRLMPPLVIVVALAALASTLSLIQGQFTPSGLFAALFYLGNYHVIANDFHGLPGGLGVVWSLAIEEHFYLFYPPLAVLLLRVGRAGLSASLLALLCGLVLAWRFWLVFHGASTDYVSMATDTRVDSILVGCLMALWHNPWLGKAAAPSGRRSAAVAMLSVAVLLGTFLYRDEVFRLTFRYTLQSVAIAALLYLAVARADHWPVRWLSARPLVYIGQVSYTIYLSHHMILLGLAWHWPQLNWFWQTLAAAVLTLAVAEPMRRWVDLPCARLRQRLHRRANAPGQRPAALAVSRP